MTTSWAERIADLEGWGWSLTLIGQAIGKSTQAVSDIKQGRTKEPGGMAAVRLHFLHSTRAEPPRAIGKSKVHAAESTAISANDEDGPPSHCPKAA